MANTAKTTAIRTGKASPPLLFRHVSPGPDDSTLKFRLLHFWEARKNVKGGPGILLGIEMLMIDAEAFIGQNRQPVMYHVADRGCGPVMNVYLWDEAAESFRLKFDASAATPTVLLVTTVNPKRLGAETLTIGEIATFLKRQPAQLDTGGITLLARIADQVKPYRQHCFVQNGMKMLRRVEVSPLKYVFATMYILIIWFLASYRVELSVYDNDEQCTFIILGDAGKDLTGKQQLIDAYVRENGGDAAELEVSLPQCFIDTIGQTKKFRIKVAHYNFTSTQLSLTAIKIVSPAELPPKNPPLKTPPGTEVENTELAESSGGAYHI
ncbi:hypothetical protein Bca52824_065324 [Brassica carinata]|uniref:Uncharacterized protein n=1 Tax=Brassica carinata TaxID=52824 RepID=A0A8X7QI11_BRACI|nr:hypothetical protein Bca52824_065324 [Brassica carinata]